MTMNNSESSVFPDEPRDIPVALIDEPQDCIDFGTVEFDVSTVVRQGAKRGVVGECVVTGRQFEAVYLHRDPFVKDRDVAVDAPMFHFELDRVWQYAPEKVDVDVAGYKVYGALREMSVAFGRAGESLGPVSCSQAPACDRLGRKLEAHLSSI